VYVFVTYRTKEVCSTVSLSDSHHMRKLVAGACMVLAPLFLLVAAVIHPEMGTSAASQANAIASDPDAWYIAHLLGLVSIVLAVPAVLGLMHMLREKQVAAGLVGGGLALLGLLAFVGIVAIEMTLWRAGDVAATTALIDRIDDTTGIVIPFFVVSLGFGLGMIALAAGLYGARAVSAVMAACLAVGAAAVVIASATAMEWLFIAGAAVLALGFGMTGFMVLSEADADWEHTPEYHGIRPAGGAAA
jgi:hypothetical protein